MRQAQAATLAALEDGHKLIEVEFPTSSLQGVSGIPRFLCCKLQQTAYRIDQEADHAYKLFCSIANWMSTSYMRCWHCISLVHNNHLAASESYNLQCLVDGHAATAVGANDLASLIAGDAEGANEMTYSMGFLRQFCRSFQQNAAATRIFFPDKKVRC